MSVNIDNTRKAYAAFAAGDIATVLELIAPDCVWHVGGRSQLAGDYVGHEQIVGYFGRLLELTDGTFTVTLDDVAESPTTHMVTSVVTIEATRQGKTLQTRMIQLGRADDAGHVAECWWFAQDAYAIDEFWGMAEIRLPDQAGQPVTA